MYKPIIDVFCLYKLSKGISFAKETKRVSLGCVGLCAQCSTVQHSFWKMFPHVKVVLQVYM